MAAVITPEDPDLAAQVRAGNRTVIQTVVDFPEVSLSSRRDVGPEGIVDRVEPIKESQAMKLCS